MLITLVVGCVWQLVQSLIEFPNLKTQYHATEFVGIYKVYRERVKTQDSGDGFESTLVVGILSTISR